MRRHPICSVALLLLLAASAHASTPNTGPKPWDSAFDDGASPTAVTGSMKCVITRIEDPEERIVEVFDEQSEGKHLVRFADRVILEARRKTDFGGRKRIDFSDLAVGQRIKVTYLAGDGTITRVKVLGSS